MAARLEPDAVQPMRQSLHHLVAKAPWSDEGVLEQVRERVLPKMEKNGPVVAWIVDDTGFPRKACTRRRSPPVLRPVGQASQLPGGGESVGGDLEFELADWVPLVSAQGMGRR